MKKLALIALVIFMITSADAQVYLKPVVTSESSPGACDASITVIPYGGTPPYEVEWYDEGTWSRGTGFTANNLCSGEFFRITVIDSKCHKMEVGMRIAPNPSEQTTLDTILIVLPTPGNNDGSLEMVYSNLPTSYSAYFLNDGGSISGPTTSFVKTNLAEDLYTFGISGGGSPMEISIPLFSDGNTPCDLFDTEVKFTHSSYYIPRSPECEYVFNPTDSIIIDSTGMDSMFVSNCSGSLLIQNNNYDAGEMTNYVYIQLDGGAANVETSDSLDEAYSYLCRGPYTIQAYNSINGFNYYNIISIFIQDSLDITYFWNIPDTIPTNTDTIYLDAVNYAAIDYSAPIDSAYIGNVNYIGSGQFEMQTAIIQGATTHYVYHTAALDSANSMIFDITTFEGDSLLCDVNNAYRHLIYYSWPEEPCDSILICHIPPGNPSAAHSIWIPCSDLQDHLDHGDEMGDCNRSMQIGLEETELKVFPNPAENNLSIQSSMNISTIEILSLDGRLITNYSVNKKSTILNIDELESSVYLVKVIYSGGFSEIRRMVKTK